MNRKTVYYSGRVQGVGFRYTTRQIAAGFAVRGFVKNLPDGRVQAVVEGEEAEIDRFLGAVAKAMAGHVRDTQMQAGGATGEFTDFDVRF